MTQNIHPTAYIAPDVVLGDNVTVAPFAVIESGVELGDNCRIGAHAVIQPFVKMGSGNVLHPHVVLGDLPQDTSFKAETVSWLIIGDNNTFREGFTAHRASKEHAETRIGSNCYFMNNSHIAHDCQIGGNVVAHQFCRIGAFAIVQGTTGLNMDVIPFSLIGGRPARHYRLNTIGLRRAGITGDRYKVLEAAFRLLRQKQPLDQLEDTAELQLLKNWLVVKSKRGTHGFIEPNNVKYDHHGE